MAKTGIIGGSGLEDHWILLSAEEKRIDTRYGQPSSPLICGKMVNTSIK